MNEINKVKQSLEKNADRANDILDGVKDRFSGLVEEAKGKGEELLDEVQDRGNKLWNKAQDRGQDAWKDTKTWITKHPGPAVGYAFLAGALLYAFFGRRED